MTDNDPILSPGEGGERKAEAQLQPSGKDGKGDCVNWHRNPSAAPRSAGGLSARSASVIICVTLIAVFPNANKGLCDERSTELVDPNKLCQAAIKQVEGQAFDLYNNKIELDGLTKIEPSQVGFAEVGFPEPWKQKALWTVFDQFLLLNDVDGGGPDGELCDKRVMPGEMYTECMDMYLKSINEEENIKKMHSDLSIRHPNR